jgi:hypothetical protein
MRATRLGRADLRRGGRHRAKTRRKYPQVLAGTVDAGAAALAIASGNSAAPTGAARVPTQPGTQAVWPADLEAAGDKALKRFTDTAHLAAVPVGPGEVAEPLSSGTAGTTSSTPATTAAATRPTTPPWSLAPATPPARTSG